MLQKRVVKLYRNYNFATLFFVLGYAFNQLCIFLVEDTIDMTEFKDASAFLLRDKSLKK